LSQVVIELPYIFVQALSYGVIVYAMIGFEWTVPKFFWYMFFMYFTFCYFTFYGMMTMAASPNHHIAAVLASAFYGLWNLFSGFIMPRTVSIFNLKIHQLQLLMLIILWKMLNSAPGVLVKHINNETLS
jgi:hypothetical protein